MRAYKNQNGLNGKPGMMISKLGTFVQTGSVTRSVTFTSNNTWQVPNNVSLIHIDCVGANGYGGVGGGRVQCDMYVSPGTTLTITIGTSRTANDLTYNATHIIWNGNYRVVVAGGGGNTAAQQIIGYGGAGGGLTGASGTSPGYGAGGTGGTQTTGGTCTGSKAGNGASGTQFYGGAGAGGGGCGGDGWYGGAGGGYGGHNGRFYGGGGGGGSSYTNPSHCINVIHTQGFRYGNGYVVITYDEILTTEVISDIMVPATQIFRRKGA